MEKENKIVKFCGVRFRKGLYFCGQTQPSHMGFIFAEKSKRYINPEKLIVDLMPCSNLLRDIKKVGVFVNADISFIIKTTALLNLNVIQLHGDEDNEYIKTLEDSFSNRLFIKPEIWKAMKVNEANMMLIDLTCADRILLDGANPGSGEKADWEIIKKNRPSKPFILAGGLDIHNIKDAINELDPDGVDLATGIETEGFKDLEKMEQIIKIVKGCGWTFSNADTEADELY
ncbi:MAG: phosphoribosylanthranilate isomerase [Oscillospiraceae bacterium]|jgi:phosphoribosylanthranilate isomerase|nr:phosphoribosylanthranilate isomerase [Oscillospiraceae bacterium]